MHWEVFGNAWEHAEEIGLEVSDDYFGGIFLVPSQS